MNLQTPLTDDELKALGFTVMCLSKGPNKGKFMQTWSDTLGPHKPMGMPDNLVFHHRPCMADILIEVASLSRKEGQSIMKQRIASLTV